LNTQTKPKPTITGPTEQVREMTEKGAERSKEAFAAMSAASTDAANVIKDCCSTALQGVQAYNKKVIEFAQANTTAYAEFMQKLSTVKSPSEFFEVSTNHTRTQLETIAEQAKQLAELARKTTLAATEPLKAGFSKSYADAA
jgi:phasin